MKRKTQPEVLRRSSRRRRLRWRLAGGEKAEAVTLAAGEGEGVEAVGAEQEE